MSPTQAIPRSAGGTHAWNHGRLERGLADGEVREPCLCACASRVSARSRGKGPCAGTNAPNRAARDSAGGSSATYVPGPSLGSCAVAARVAPPIPAAGRLDLGNDTAGVVGLHTVSDLRMGVTRSLTDSAVRARRASRRRGCFRLNCRCQSASIASVASRSRAFCALRCGSVISGAPPGALADDALLIARTADRGGSEPRFLNQQASFQSGPPPWPGVDLNGGVVAHAQPPKRALLQQATVPQCTASVAGAKRERALRRRERPLTDQPGAVVRCSSAGEATAAATHACGAERNSSGRRACVIRCALCRRAGCACLRKPQAQAEVFSGPDAAREGAKPWLA